MRPCRCTSFKRFLRADAFDPVIEIGADENREIDEPFAGDAPAVEQPIEHDRLRHDRPECPLAREKLLAGNRQEAHQPRRAEEQRVVVLARRRPDVAARSRPCAPPALRPRTGACTVGTPIRRSSSRASATISLRQPRRHRRLRVRLRQIAARQRGGALLFVSLPSGAALRDLVRLARRRRAVEHEHELERVLGHEPRGPVEEAREMRRRAAFRVLQRRSVAKPDQREKLIQLAVAVNRQRLAAQRLERDRVLGDDWREDERPRRDSDTLDAQRAARQDGSRVGMLGSRGGWCTISLDVARICGVWMRDAMARRYAYIAFAAATLAVALPLVHAQRASETASRPTASPAPKILVEKNVEARMRDGVVLRADVYRPDTTERLPALLQRTPYSKNPGQDGRPVPPPRCTRLRRRRAGYARALHVRRRRAAARRGRGRLRHRSSGRRRCPTSNGRVGTFGGSYSATTQLIAATAAAAASGRDVPGVLVSTAATTWSSRAARSTSPTGCRGISARAPTCGAARISRRSIATVRSALNETGAAAVRDELAVARAAQHRGRDGGAPRTRPAYFEMLSPPVVRRATGRPSTSKRATARFDVPAYHVTGWYDTLLTRDAAQLHRPARARRIRSRALGAAAARRSVDALRARRRDRRRSATSTLARAPASTFEALMVRLVRLLAEGRADQGAVARAGAAVRDGREPSGATNRSGRWRARPRRRSISTAAARRTRSTATAA